MYTAFSCEQNEHRFLSIIYHLGKGAIDEIIKSEKRIINKSGKS